MVFAVVAAAATVVVIATIFPIVVDVVPIPIAQGRRPARRPLLIAAAPGRI